MTKRSFALIAAAAIAPAGWGQEGERTFSFESNAATLPTLLDRLSIASGTRLVASAGLSREVLAIRFKDVTLSEAKARIASALGANWIDEQGTFRLIENEQARQADWRAESKHLADGFARAIARMAKDNLGSGLITSEEAKKMAQDARQIFSGTTQGGPQRGGGSRNMMASFSTLMGRSPGSRAITRLLQSMNPADIATIQPGTRVVFANPANRAQLALPSNSWQTVDTFLQEQKTFNESMRDAQGDQAPLPIFGAFQGAEGRPVKAYLIATRTPVGDNLSFQFIVANQDGQTMGFGFQGLAAEPAPAPTETEVSNADETPIEVSNVGKTLANLLGEGSGQPGTFAMSNQPRGGRLATEFVVATTEMAFSSQPRPKLAPDILTFVLNPERNEPLSTAPGELYLGLAKARDKNMVALLPDRLFQPANRRAATGPVRPNDVLRLSKTDWRMSVNDENGWLVVRPNDPVATRTERIDRAALGVLLRTLDQKSEARLDDLLAYARTMPAVGSMTGIDINYLRVIDPPTAMREIGRMFSGERDMLRLYATFGPAQKQALIDGRPVAIASMSPDQRAIVNQIVYNSFDGPRRQNSRSRGGPPGARGATFSFFDSNNERTELLAGGIPMQAELRMRVDQEVVVLASNSATKASQTFTPESLGRMLARSERPEFAAMTANMNFDEYRVGRETEHEFTFVLGAGLILQRELEDTTFDRSRRGVAMSALPDDVRKIIEDSKAEASRGMSSRGTGGGIRTSPAGQREP